MPAGRQARPETAIRKRVAIIIMYEYLVYTLQIQYIDYIEPFEIIAD